MKLAIVLAMTFVLMYLAGALLAITKYKYIRYGDIDLNGDKILEPSEIMYILDTRVRYKCYTNDKEYVYKNNISDSEKYRKIILEIYSLKDGLSIKEIEVK